MRKRIAGMSILMLFGPTLFANEIKPPQKNVIKINGMYYQPTGKCQIPDWIKLNPDGSWVIDTSKLAKEVYANLNNMTFKNSVNIGSTPVSFSTSGIINQFYNYLHQAVMNAISIIMPTVTSPFQAVLPFDLTKELTDLAKQTVNGFWCLLSRPKPWGFSFQIPTSISIRLPCGYVGTTLPTQMAVEFLNQIPNKGLDVTDRVGQCIASLGQGPSCKPIVRAWKSLTVEGNLVLAGEGKEYADKSNQQISQEVQKLVDTASGSDVVLHSNDDKVYYNPTAVKVREALIRKASDMGGTIYQPGKEQAQNLPPEAKVYYDYLVDRQMARRDIALSYEKKIRRAMEKTAMITAEMEGLANSPSPLSVSPSYFLTGGFIALFVSAVGSHLFGGGSGSSNSQLQSSIQQTQQQVQNLTSWLSQANYQTFINSNPDIQNLKSFWSSIFSTPYFRRPPSVVNVLGFKTHTIYGNQVFIQIPETVNDLQQVISPYGFDGLNVDVYKPIPGNFTQQWTRWKVLNVHGTLPDNCNFYFVSSHRWLKPYPTPSTIPSDVRPPGTAGVLYCDLNYWYGYGY